MRMVAQKSIMKSLTLHFYTERDRIRYGAHLFETNPRIEYHPLFVMLFTTREITETSTQIKRNKKYSRNEDVKYKYFPTYLDSLGFLMEPLL